ncbi:MAG TPA: DUF721 domain-containing protein [Syntrophorhabdaceae bacterium]|nr:DUF721 domain-containing protein [Syntrophorhabdaceae bacterium]
MAFVPLKNTLGKILKGHNIKNLDEIKIFSSWPEMVGERIAAHTRPVNVNNKVLFVEVDDPVWLTQLRYMKREIVNKIDTQIAAGLFKDIRFFLRRTN